MQVLDITKFKFENRVCDLCGSKEFDPHQTVIFLKKKFQFVRCLSCDLIYQNPLLSSESRKYLYESQEYWDNKNSKLSGKDFLNYYSYLEEFKSRRKTDELRVKWVTSRLPPKSRVLDLGCGDGLFVSVLKKSGFEAYGLDISSSMSAVAKDKYGVEVINGDAEKKWDFDKPFDAICMNGSISNFINPSLVFKQIQLNLRTGGYFFFQFADGDHLISRLMGSHFYTYRPSAVSVYSKKTILSYCEKYGFNVETIKNDIQLVPLARFFGMIRLPFLIDIFKFIHVDHWDIKITLPMCYVGCAVLNK